jgi:large-conductance mechanosensitive channel
VIGAAFTAVIQSIVDNMITPLRSSPEFPVKAAT